MIITLDGPAGAGKGTVARIIAERYGLPYLDTGSLYRAVALKCLRDPGLTPERAAQGLTPGDLQAEGLRDEATAAKASEISALPAVRAALKRFQQDFANQPGGAVLDGRDTGTVICPTADIKFFLTASPAVRAQRRFLQLQEAGQNVSYDSLFADIVARDTRDMTRTDAPLCAAPDAKAIDTSYKNVDEVVAELVQHIEQVRATWAHGNGNIRT